jgi:hypothetical protein
MKVRIYAVVDTAKKPNKVRAVFLTRAGARAWIKYLGPFSRPHGFKVQTAVGSISVK